ncbi:MAG TPA: amidohydrolase [Gemmatimonadales bacterium]|nr:amidohydrolase [Gemmatimonadales bacterium]
MRHPGPCCALLAVLLGSLPAPVLNAQVRDRGDAAARLDSLKAEAARAVDARADLVQRVVDQLFSYGELGFQEVETSRYLVGLLRREGFAVDTGVAGIPTAWVARWGRGRPVIALGSDIDAIPQASQVPGVACRLPLVEGAPGHGEGHNSGQAVNLAAALVVKQIMEREKLPGTLVLWPGVAEEQLAGKPFLVRAGIFRDADVVLFSHVGSEFGTSWGLTSGSGLVSVLYSFSGKAAHAAGRPWQGRSALDAVQLMDIGWNFRREHLPLRQRSHSVVVDGGDQPNVVPQTASAWYYLRELDYQGIKGLWAVADSVAQGAALMTGTTLLPTRVLGASWPRHYNRPVAEALAANIERVGMPGWTPDDQAFARAVQRAVGQPDSGLQTTVDSLTPPTDPARNLGGPSDDIGDVSWTVPTVVLYYPANVDGLPGHHWSSAMAMATPIAHKGSVAGAKAEAMTMLDLLLRPALVDSARAYFQEVQTREIKYQPLIRPDDQPPIELNREILERYRPAMRPYYYDARRYRSYLEQLGVGYPVLPDSGGACRVTLRRPDTTR